MEVNRRDEVHVGRVQRGRVWIIEEEDIARADPEVVRSLRRQGLRVRYGDGIASEFLESLPLKDTRWVVSTLPDMASNRDLLRGLRELHFAGEVAVVAREELDGAPLEKLGVPVILYPMRNAVDYAVETLTAIIHPKEDKP